MRQKNETMTEEELQSMVIEKPGFFKFLCIKLKLIKSGLTEPLYIQLLVFMILTGLTMP